MTDSNNRNTLKEAFDAELMKRLEENPPEIPTYEEFSAMVDKSLAERCRRRKRIAGIAAGFVVVLLAGILACTNLTTDVDADKNPKEEIITEDGVIIEDGGWGSSDGEDNVWVIEEWYDVEGAKARFPEMLIPKYVPDRYEFEQLTIECLASRNTTYEYIFKSSYDDVLEIEINDRENRLESFSVDSATDTISSSKGIIYIQENKTKIATVLMDDGVLINIWYDFSKQELVKLIEALEF